MTANQLQFFDYKTTTDRGRLYRPMLTARENGKGCMDVDTVKGCTLGMQAYPNGGCYGRCYANTDASRYRVDFATSVTRRYTRDSIVKVFCDVRDHYATWYRIGVSGDPCHNWNHTVNVCKELAGTGKVPVIITKHWRALTGPQLDDLAKLGAVINTSVSGLDTDAELEHRLAEMDRVERAGMVSVCRVITCEYGDTEWGNQCRHKQEYLLTLDPVIDNPLRLPACDPRVVSGDILVSKVDHAVGGGKSVSLHAPDIYLGTCKECPDQCGVPVNKSQKGSQ